jgi:predicted nucleic acid-binding protein
VILCDTGPIVAAALDGDDHHHACVELFTGLHLAGRPLLVPATVVAEVGYLLAREAGARVEALFLTALADGDFSRSTCEQRTTGGRQSWCGHTRTSLWAPPTQRSSRSPSGWG